MRKCIAEVSLSTINLDRNPHNQYHLDVAEELPLASHSSSSYLCTHHAIPRLLSVLNGLVITYLMPICSGPQLMSIPYVLLQAYLCTRRKIPSSVVLKKKKKLLFAQSFTEIKQLIYVSSELCRIQNLLHELLVHISSMSVIYFNYFALNYTHNNLFLHSRRSTLRLSAYLVQLKRN